MQETKVVLTAEDRTRAAFDSAVGNLNRFSGASELASGTLQTLMGAVTIGGIVEMVRQTAAAADELGKLSQRSGIAVSTLSELKFAAEINGASLSDLEQGIKGLANKMLEASKGSGEAADAFRAIGVSVKDAGGNMRSVDAVLADIADAFNRSADGAGKAAIANKLMEESGVALIPMLNQGSRGLREMAEQARDFGVVVEDDAAKAAAEFKHNLDLMQAAGRGFANSLGNEVIPVLNEFLATAAEASKNTGGIFPAINARINAAMGIGEGNTLRERIADVDRMIKQADDIHRRFPGGIIGNIAGMRWASLSNLREVLAVQERNQALAFSDPFEGVERRRLGLSGTGQDTISQALARQNEERIEQEKKKKAATEAAAEADRLAAFETARLAHNNKLLNAEIADTGKFLKSVNDLQAEGLQSASDGLRGLRETLQARRDENDEIGLSAEALSELRAERLEAAAAQREETAAALDAQQPGSLLAGIYREQAEALREIAKEQRTGDAKQAVIDTAEAAKKAWQDISSDIAGGLTDAILAGGTDGWELLKRQIEATVIRATITPLIQGGVNSLLQGVGLGPGGAGGSSAIGSMAGSLAGSSLLGGLAGAGGFFGQAALGFTSASTGSLIAAGNAAMGAGQIGAGFGSYLGAAAPWLIGGYLIADQLGLFKGATPHRGGAFVADSAGGGFKATNANFGGFGLDWGAFRSDRSSTLDESVRLLTTGIADLLGDTASRFGTGGSFRVAGRFAADGDDPSVGALRILDAAGVTVAEISEKFSKDARKGFDQFSQSAGETVKTVLDGMDLPTWVESVLAELGQAPTLNEIATALNNVGAAIDSAFASISQTTAQSVRAIELSVLDAEGQYAYLDNEIGTMLERLRTATDPATITSLFNSANADLSAAFGLLDADQQRASSTEFIDRFYELESVAQASLAARDTAAAAIADKQQVAADRMVDAAQQMLDAANRMQAVGGAGEQMQSAADGMNQALRNIRINIGGLVSGEVG